MDYHDVGAGQGSLGPTPDQRYRAALGQITQPTLVVAIATDILYPPVEQKELVNLIPRAQLSWLQSPHGHDGFLIDMAALNQQVLQFRFQTSPRE
ncbi:MAG: hypothetical protein LVS60_11370 [Nodosilinea sp. LVE1205-7]|jgi:homoserine O-acetyltransferase